MDKALLARHILGKPTQGSQRLEFPVSVQQKKHFLGARGDQVHLGEVQEHLKRPNKLDVSDIEGAQPKYSHCKRNQRRFKTLDSEPTYPQDIRDSLDQLASLPKRKRDLSLKQLGQGTAENRPPSALKHDLCKSKDNRRKYQQLKTEPAGVSSLNKYRIVDPEQRYDSRKNLFQNPTYISSLFL